MIVNAIERCVERVLAKVHTERTPISDLDALVECAPKLKPTIYQPRFVAPSLTPISC